MTNRYSQHHFWQVSCLKYQVRVRHHLVCQSRYMHMHVSSQLQACKIVSSPSIMHNQSRWRWHEIFRLTSIQAVYISMVTSTGVPSCCGWVYLYLKGSYHYSYLPKQQLFSDTIVLAFQLTAQLLRIGGWKIIFSSFARSPLLSVEGRVPNLLPSIHTPQATS